MGFCQTFYKTAGMNNELLLNNCWLIQLLLKLGQFLCTYTVDNVTFFILQDRWVHYKGGNKCASHNYKGYIQCRYSYLLPSIVEYLMS